MERRLTTEEDLRYGRENYVNENKMTIMPGRGGGWGEL